MGQQWRKKKTTVGNITANKQTQLIWQNIKINLCSFALSVLIYSCQLNIYLNGIAVN